MALSSPLPSILLPPSIILFLAVVAVPDFLVARLFVATVALSSESENRSSAAPSQLGHIDLAYTSIYRKTGLEQAIRGKNDTNHVIPTFL